MDIIVYMYDLYHSVAYPGGGGGGGGGCSSFASQTFARKTGGSGDISIVVAVPVERTECNFCCVINLNSCACRFINIALQRIYVTDRKH